MTTTAASTQYECLRIDRVVEWVAEVVLARPEKLNTMTPTFFAEVQRAFETLDADPTVNVIIVRAEGRMFTAGLDLKEAASLTGDSSACVAERAAEFLRTVTRLQQSFDAIEKCSKPVIAAVHNRCIGGGVDLITAADIRVCTQDASFSIMETKIGIVADLGTLQRIGRIVGKGYARELAFTGAAIDADRASHMGLVNKVYSNIDAMLAGARELASTIAANSPLVVQGTKAVLSYSDDHSLDDGKRFVAVWNAAFLNSDDLTEAMMAFMQKRAPKFRNRL